MNINSAKEGESILENQNKTIKKLSKIEDLYQLKTQDMCIEIEYAKNGKSFNECMLNILKAKL